MEPRWLNVEIVSRELSLLGSAEQALSTQDSPVCERNGLPPRLQDTLEDMEIDDQWHVCTTTSM